MRELLKQFELKVILARDKSFLIRIDFRLAKLLASGFKIDYEANLPTVTF
jgi:hypothetical protein